MQVTANFPLPHRMHEVKPNDYRPIRSMDDMEVLVRLIQSKSEYGFHMLYDKYSAALYGTISKFVRRSDIADDLLQETFIKIWKHIDTFDANKGTLYTWMLNIARNLAIDYLRSSSHKTQSLSTPLDMFTNGMDHKTSTGSSFSDMEIADFKGRALSVLAPKYAAVIDMTLFLGWTNEQTAARLNLPLGTVKTRIRKGIELLKILYLR